MLSELAQAETLIPKAPRFGAESRVGLPLQRLMRFLGEAWFWPKSAIRFPRLGLERKATGLGGKQAPGFDAWRLLPDAVQEGSVKIDRIRYQKGKSLRSGNIFSLDNSNSGLYFRLTPPVASTAGRGPLRRPLLFLGVAMRTIVYVDALNLYYGALKGTGYKWLDLQKLFAKILPSQYSITGIKYFTAQVSGTPNDSTKPLRQRSYIRALRHVSPNLEIYYGHFLRHSVSLPLETPIGGQRNARVIRTEEKGSDVSGKS